MSNLDKWNKNRTEKKKTYRNRYGKIIEIKYWDKCGHREKLMKLAEYFMIGMTAKLVGTRKDRGTTEGVKYIYSTGSVVKDIIDEYLNRDDIKELLEQIDKEDTSE